MSLKWKIKSSQDTASALMKFFSKSVWITLAALGARVFFLIVQALLSSGPDVKKVFKFNKECKENGDLYGSVKPKEITNLIKSQLNAEVSPSQILLKEELNKIGLFKASINFHSEVQATISIKIDKIQSK